MPGWINYGYELSIIHNGYELSIISRNIIPGMQLCRWLGESRHLSPFLSLTASFTWIHMMVKGQFKYKLLAAFPNVCNIENWEKQNLQDRCCALKAGSPALYLFGFSPPFPNCKELNKAWIFLSIAFSTSSCRCECCRELGPPFLLFVCFLF